MVFFGKILRGVNIIDDESTNLLVSCFPVMYIMNHRDVMNKVFLLNYFFQKHQMIL